MSSERPDDYRRIAYILSLIHQKLTCDQIDAKLKQRDSGRSNYLRGFSNESRVAKLLRKAPFVVYTERTVSYSPEDMAGYDLYVHLQGIEPLKAVGVQVKSSQLGIDRFFKERVHNPYLKKGQNGFRLWLMDRRLVMINGSLPDVEIIDSFIGQVEEMVREARLERDQQIIKSSGSTCHVSH